MLQAKLKAVGGTHDGEVIPLQSKRFLIGREEDCHLRPNSDSVSRHHCAFIVDEFSVRVRDLGSTNGTYVNGQRVQGSVGLQSGDHVEIGNLEFEVVISSEAVGGKNAVASGETTQASSNAASPDFQVSSEDASAKTIVDIPVAEFPTGEDDNTRMRSGETTIIAAQPAANQLPPVEDLMAGPHDVEQPTPPPVSPAASPAQPIVDPMFLQQQLQQLLQQQLAQQQASPPPSVGAQTPPATAKKPGMDLPEVRLPDPEETGVKDEPPPPKAEEQTEDEKQEDKPEAPKEDSRNVAADIIRKYMRRRGT